MKAVLLAAAMLAAPVAAQPAVGDTVAITNARLVTVADPAPTEGGTLVMRGGRIVAAGRGVAVPAGAQVVDAGGRFVTPGLFAAFTQLGLAEVHAVDQANDTEAERSPFQASLDMTVALNPQETAIPITRIEGVTRAATGGSPDAKLFAGQGALIDMGADDGVVMRPRAFQYAAYGEAGARIAGGSRSAAFIAMVNALEEGQRFARNPAAYGNDQDPAQIVPRRDAEVLAQVVDGRQPLLVRVDRSSDIRQVLTLKQRFPRLRLVLLSANEGWMVARDIAAAGVPVVTLGMDNLPNRFEMLGATMNNVGRLTAAGVTVAFGTPDLDASFQPRLLPQYAGNMVAQGRLPGGVGLSWPQAMAALTINAARVWGVERELGTLEAGKRADVVIWDGDPLELASAPTAVFIDGVAQPLDSRQTKLRDRYLGIGKPAALPPAYKR